MEALLRLAVMNTLGAAALAVVALAVGRWCRRPAVVHGLWLLVLLKLLTPPLIDVPVPWLETPAPVASASNPAPAPLPEQSPPVAALEEAPTQLAEAPAPLLEVQEDAPLAVPLEEPAMADATSAAFSDWQQLPSALDWRNGLCLLWLAGSVVWFTLAGWRACIFNKLLAHGRPAPPDLQGRAWQLALRMGMRDCPEVIVLPARVAPLLWVMGGEALLCLPEALVRALAPGSVDTLMAHELAHYRRRDYWVRALEFVALGLYWWNPVVWFARRRLREAEEECCDAWVIAAMPDMARTYATALVDTLEFLAEEPSATPVAASGIGSVTDLKRRLTMIMRGKTPRALGWAGGLLLATLMALLPLWPRAAAVQAADEDDPPPSQANRDEQKLRKELQRLESDLQQKLQEVKALEQKLRAASSESEVARKRMQESMSRIKEAARQAARAEAERARAEAARARAEAASMRDRMRKELVRNRGTGSGQGEGESGQEEHAAGRRVIHLEIVCSPDEAPAIQRKLQELRHELRSGSHVRIEVRTESGSRTRGPHGPAAQPEAPGAPTPPPPPPPPHMRGPAGGPGGPGDRRIDALERRLDSLLRELESIRREIRDSRPGRPGRAPVPPPPPPEPDADGLR